MNILLGPDSVLADVGLWAIWIIFGFTAVVNYIWLREHRKASFPYTWLKLATVCLSALWMLQYTYVILVTYGVLPQYDHLWYSATIVRPTILLTGACWLAAGIARLKTSEGR